MKIDNTYMLLTAAHVCFDVDEGLPPLFTWGRNGPHAILGRRGMWEYRPTELPDADVAVIELTDEDANNLSSIYHFTMMGEIATAKEKTPGIHYMIVGYPASRNRASLTNVPGLATYFITGDIDSVRSEYKSDKSDEHHFALCVPKRGIKRLGGGDFHLPKPAGMSGGGVFRLEIDVQQGLASSPLLVGIGIEWHKDKRIFVATRVQTAMPLIEDALVNRLGPAT